MTFEFLKDISSKKKKETLNKGLEKSGDSLFSRLGRAIIEESKVDEEVLDDLEEVLIASDVRTNTTPKIIEHIEACVAKDKYLSTSELNKILREKVGSLLPETCTDEVADFSLPADRKSYVMMAVDVNGTGRTTIIGKLASQLIKKGLKVVLGVAGTFCATTIGQLQVWADRAGVPVIKRQLGNDPAPVTYDTFTSAVKQGADVVIIDTAGRLHNKINLMNKLNKIKRVMQKVIADAPHEVLLVLNGSTGQDAFGQAKEFTKTTEVTALAVTKLDGTAKGDVVIDISNQFQAPVKYIGVSGGTDDLQIFSKYKFVDSFFRQ